MHLWDVSVEDDIVKKAENEIDEILEVNLNIAEKSLGVYDEFAFLLKEKPRVEAFLAEENHTREDTMAEVQKYEDMIVRIRNEMPTEIRLNMFLVQCQELNKRLAQECEDLIKLILDKTADNVWERANQVTKDLETVKSNIQTKATSAEHLVQVENHLD